MLQILRDKAQGWIAWVIIALIIATFFLLGTESFLFSRNEAVIAKVNGADITARALDDLYQRVVAEQGIEPSREQLLKSLIDQAVLLQASITLGMRVSPSRVSEVLFNFPFLQNKEGVFSPPAYQQFLSQAGYTDQSFRRLLQEALLKEQLQKGILLTAFSSEQEVKDLARLLLQKRSFRYMVVEGKAPKAISEEAIKAYYDAHLTDFFTEEQIALEYVPLSLKAISKGLSDNEAQEKFVDLADKMASLSYDYPDSLQPLSDQLSLPTYKTSLFNKVNGPHEKLLQHPLVIESAFSESVKENKNNSELIKIDDAHYIVLRQASLVPPEQKPLAVVQEEIKKILMKQAAQHAAKEKVESIIHDPKRLQKYKWKEVQGIMRDNKEIDPSILDTAFSLSLEGTALKSLSLKNGGYAVIWINKVKEGKVSELSQSERVHYQEALSNYLGDLTFSLYLNQLLKEAKINENL